MFGKKNNWDPEAANRNRYPLLYGGKAPRAGKKQGKKKGMLIEWLALGTIGALAVGIVVVSQSYLKASETRNLASQLHKSQMAAYLFKEQYRSLPGDIPDAATHGLTDSSCAPDVGNKPPVVPGCGGNGNGLLTPEVHNTENISFWHHLYRAGFVDHAYDGISIQFGEGAPETAIENVGIWAKSSLWRGHEYQNYFYIGLSDKNFSPIFAASQAEDLDAKMDDGLPATGKIVFADTAKSCVDTNRTPWRYLQQENAACTILLHIPTE